MNIPSSTQSHSSIMLSSRLIFGCLLPLLLVGSASPVKVSFFGASHISMPLQEAKLSTNVRLRFRTHQEHAMLMLAAGRTDFCMLQLDEGRVRFRFRLNDTLVELWSPAQAVFNDREWHDVSLQRHVENVTMQIDEHIVSQTIREQRAGTELNVHFGVFLGGPGDYSAEYLSGVENLRGCLSDVYYNNVNVLKRAKEGMSHVSSVGVQWQCSAEFDAEAEAVVGFVEPEAHVVLSKPTVHEGESWTMEFRTIEPTTTLLYNSGPDFVGLELVDRRARLLVGKGSNVVELIATQTDCSDGQWHNVTISYSPSMVSLTVDGSTQRAAFANGSSQIIELSEEYAVGGITAFRRRRAMNRKLKAVQHSFLGCVRNLQIDRQPVGFPHFKVTQGVAVGCAWRYPCLGGRSPCLASGTCSQVDVDSFNCRCEQAFCLRADFTDAYKIFTRSDLLSELELVAVQPLQVLEGEAEFVTFGQIGVLLDYGKFDVAESGVVFTVAQPPKHGRIVIAAASNEAATSSDTSNATSTSQRFFSLVDLSADRVRYVHSGDEHASDHMTIDMQLMAPAEIGLPEYLDRKHRFVLHVNVTAVNDPPVLQLPANRVLRLTQGIAKVLSADWLQAVDSDSAPEALMYSLRPPQGDLYRGVVEVGGQAVTMFSQADVNAGVVTYTMTPATYESLVLELAVQVSDGIETSALAYLPVSVTPMHLRMVNNTGLVLVHKSAAVVTPWNLSFASNSEDDVVDVKFTIVEPPHFGNIQKLRSVDNSWITVDTFTSDLIQLGHIRYIHNNDFPVQDDFKFIASFGQFNSIKYDFRLTFTKLRIGLQTQNSLLINGTRDTPITARHLHHQTTPVPTFVRNIIYTVVQPPKYGQIAVVGHGEPSFAREFDSFTQLDIDKGLIVYRTHRQSYASFIDTFEFTVSVAECDDVEAAIKMVFNPPADLVESLTYQAREGLQLDEGASVRLTRRNFAVDFARFEHLVFRVSTAPEHARLCQQQLVSDAAAIDSEMQTIQQFTLQQLSSDLVYYCHDDTETTADRFDLLVLSDQADDFQYVSAVPIAIRPVNDNGPTRVGDAEAVFQVVRNQSRLLSAADLSYTDPDVPASQTEHIVYTQVLASNGEFQLNGLPAEQFRQTDIDAGGVRFRHWDSADDAGAVSFTVSDGYFDVPGAMRIQAADPFIKIGPRNASIVQEGRYIVLTMAELAIETNVDARAEEIVYQVVNDPDFGILHRVEAGSEESTSNATASTALRLQTGNFTVVRNFTQADVRQRRILYTNTVVASMDEFRYRVSFQGIWAESDLKIRVYPSAYWDLLQIRMNQTLYVEESTSVKITRKILEIVHPNISPGDIGYVVTQSPQHGYLEIQSITSDDEYNCKIFDQSSINTEKIFYIQAGVNQSGDHFVFDVTNGITWLRGLRLNIVIIPDSMYVMAQNITVDEGAAVRLEPTDMLPYSVYYQGKVLEYKILVQPRHGELRAGKSMVTRFTFKQLESGQVQYVHDGSENDTDVIRFMAIAKNQNSVPFDVWFAVQPVNDELPQLVTNTGVQMWLGGVAVLRTGDLMAQDNDTPASQLNFIVTQITGGSLFRDSAPQTSISNFTQAEISSERIRFRHDARQSSDSAELRFYITDGLHQTVEHTLHVITNPVALELVRNDLLHVFPLTRKIILHEQLNFRCSDADREVRFRVTIQPQFGRLLLLDETAGSGSGEAMASACTEFTQNDVLKGRLLYEHTHAMIELRSNDSFYFDVSSALANTLHDQIFNIEISVSSGGLLRFLPVPRLHLDEGASAPIHLDLSKVLEYLETRAGIPMPELFIVTYPPEHGRIVSVETNGDLHNNETHIALSSFQAGRILYQHDHSDTLADTIHMSVWLAQKQLFLCNLTLPVTVQPVNDQPFELITNATQMTVVEGENRTITRAELLTLDADTAPADIVYDVISGPTLGALIKLSDEGVAQDILMYGNQFTQADVDAGRILYTHFGVALSTTFYFKVSDGQFMPKSHIFQLNVIPVQLTGAGMQREIVVVAQGAQAATIETKHLPLETNARRARLVYDVVEVPRSGYIMVDERAAQRFGQEQLDGGRVTYVQSDMAQSRDVFKVNVYIPDSNHSASVQFDVKMIVEPFIKINGISIVSTDKIRLTSSLLLDNPTLSKLNRYNPLFTITRAPDHGRIRKIIRASSAVEAADTSSASASKLTATNDKNITAFTYKELKSGIVYFVARELPAKVNSIYDSFEYTLQFRGVQPGQGFVPIEIHKTKAAANGDVISYNDANNVVATSQTAFPFNIIVLAGLVAVVMLLGVLMAVLIRCRSARLDKQPSASVHAKSYPPALPRPPEFMKLNSGHPMYASSLDSRDGGGGGGGGGEVATASSTPLPVLSSIPHCKVIPIDMTTDDDDCDGDGDCDDMQETDGCSEQDEMMDAGERQQLHDGGGGGAGMMGRSYGGYGGYNDDDLDGWSSSCDAGGMGAVSGHQEVTYTSINGPSMHMQQQQQHPMMLQQQPQQQQQQAKQQNPLLRRNQYWV